MGLWVSILSLLLSSGVLFLSYRRAKNDSFDKTSKVPDHVWDELASAIPSADYNYMRATNSYMTLSPSDLIARLNYIGSVHDPEDPKQVRLSILELRLAELEMKLDAACSEIPNDIHIIWLAISSIATISSLVALVFYLLQNGYLPPQG